MRKFAMFHYCTCACAANSVFKCRKIGGILRLNFKKRRMPSNIYFHFVGVSFSKLTNFLTQKKTDGLINTCF